MNVARLAIVDGEAELGARVDGFIQLAGIGGTKRSRETQLEDEVGFRGVPDEGELAGFLEGRVELLVTAVGVPLHGSGQRSASALALETKMVLAAAMAVGMELVEIDGC